MSSAPQDTTAETGPGPAAAADGSALELRDVTVTFGGLTALDSVGLQVGSGEVHGVIGPNGAGKTTLFNVACGFVRPDSGTLTRRGRTIDRLRPRDLPGLGMARTLQSLGLFDRMTVLDNVMIGADHHASSSFLADLVGFGGRDDARVRDRARAALEDLGVAAYAGRYPPSLPYPIRKRVALARALVSEPELLLLDEPASGLSGDEMQELGDLVRDLAGRMSVMLVEHHMDLVMRVCDRITVLNFGKVIASGTPAEVREDPAVVAAYLGEGGA